MTVKRAWHWCRGNTGRAFVPAPWLVVRTMRLGNLVVLRYVQSNIRVCAGHYFIDYVSRMGCNNTWHAIWIVFITSGLITHFYSIVNDGSCVPDSCVRTNTAVKNGIDSHSLEQISRARHEQDGAKVTAREEMLLQVRIIDMKKGVVKDRTLTGRIFWRQEAATQIFLRGVDTEPRLPLSCACGLGSHSGIVGCFLFRKI